MRIKAKTATLAMEHLEAILKETFTELNYLNVSLDIEYFYIEFSSSTKDMAKVMRKLDGLVRPYIAEHGDREVSYVFNINKGKELVNIIRYNEQEDGFKVMMNIAGKAQRLFVVDLLGIGDYSVFNQDFECLGVMYRPVRTPAMGQYRMDTVTSFADASYWTTSSKALKPHLTKIIQGVAEQLKSRS